MNTEEIRKLASHKKNEAVEHIFNRLLLQRIVTITQRLSPPPEATKTVEQVLSRAVEAGDREAQNLVTDAGRESLRQEAREVVDNLLAEDNGVTTLNVNRP